MRHARLCKLIYHLDPKQTNKSSLTGRQSPPVHLVVVKHTHCESAMCSAALPPGSAHIRVKSVNMWCEAEPGLFAAAHHSQGRRWEVVCVRGACVHAMPCYSLLQLLSGLEGCPINEFLAFALSVVTS